MKPRNALMHENWFKASLCIGTIPFRRWSVVLAILSFICAGCAPRVNNVSQLGSCTDNEAGYPVIYYYDKNDVLVSAEKRDSDNSNLRPNLNSRDASGLIATNSTIKFHEDPYPFHDHVSNLNTGSAVYAVVSDEQCPVFLCVFKTKATDWLSRDVKDTGYKKNCRDMTCPKGVIPCGAYWCCRP